AAELAADESHRRAVAKRDLVGVGPTGKPHLYIAVAAQRRAFVGPLDLISGGNLQQLADRRLVFARLIPFATREPVGPNRDPQTAAIELRPHRQLLGKNNRPRLLVGIE